MDRFVIDRADVQPGRIQPHPNAVVPVVSFREKSRTPILGVRLKARNNPVADYATFTSMDFGRAFSLFARRTVSTPSLNSAATVESSASSGTAKLRVKLP